MRCASCRSRRRIQRRGRDIRTPREDRSSRRSAESHAAGRAGNRRRVSDRRAPPGPARDRLGATVGDSRRPTADQPSLEILDVDASFDRIAATAGSGSAAARARLLRELLGRATRDEQDFLLRLLSGELRQGALEGVLLEAIARASGIAAARVRRATMLAGDIGVVAVRRSSRERMRCRASSCSRSSRCSRCSPTRRRMSPTRSTNLGEASFEYKLDGARIQAHKVGDEVRVFSRNLRDVTIAVPEVVNVVRAMPARELVLDGEAIVLRPDGTPQPFQITMRRFGRKLDVDRLKETLPITPFFFDALYLDGDALVDEPLTRRIATLDELVVAGESRSADRHGERARRGRVRRPRAGDRSRGSDGEGARRRLRRRPPRVGVAQGQAGADAGSRHPGGRVGKRPPEGHAQQPAPRRARCRARRLRHAGQDVQGPDGRDAGLADEAVSGAEIARDHYTVYLRPEVVAEIAFNDIQASPQYPGGLALRFARVKRYRDDKTAAEADTFATHSDDDLSADDGEPTAGPR